MRRARLPIRRMIHIDQQLRNKQYPNCKTIAKEFEVNYKTIHRDIEYMRYQLDAPIKFDPHENGYYYSEPNYFLPVVLLKESELFSFMVTEKILKQYQNTPYYEQIKGAVDKILQFLPDEISSQNVMNLYDFQQAPASSIDQHKYSLLEQAVREQCRVKIRYHSLYRDEINEREVDPYYILNKGGTWYFIGHCHLHDEVRIFALNRVLTIDLTDSYFDPPADFDKEKYLGNSFQIIRNGINYHIRLKFTSYQARWIRERKWHKTQKLTDLEDGSLILEMDVTGLSDVKRWVLQYGAEVEVLEPGELREGIAEEVKKMKRIYYKSSCTKFLDEFFRMLGHFGNNIRN